MHSILGLHCLHKILPLLDLKLINESILMNFFVVDSKSIDENANIPVEVLQALKDLGLFGMLVPQEYGK